MLDRVLQDQRRDRDYRGIDRENNARSVRLAGACATDSGIGHEVAASTGLRLPDRESESAPEERERRREREGGEEPTEEEREREGE